MQPSPTATPGPCAGDAGPDAIPRERITAVVLAGGRGQRLGGLDKGLVELGGKMLVEHVLAALRPQAATVVISANRNLERYGAFGYPVVCDADGDFRGPLAGVASAMQAARTPYLLTAPCDSPLVPADLARRLGHALARDAAQLCVAHDGVRVQPMFALLSCGLLPELLAYLAAGGRRVDAWCAGRRLALADFSPCPSAFLNLNRPEDRAALERALGA